MFNVSLLTFSAAEQAASNELNEAELLGELDESVETPTAVREEHATETSVEAAKPVASAKAVPKAAKLPKTAAKRKAAPEKKSPVPVLTPMAVTAPVVQQSPEKTQTVVVDLSSPKVEEIQAPENGAGSDVPSQVLKVPVSKMTEEEVSHSPLLVCDCMTC